MNSLQGTTRHTCCHCQTEVLTIKGSTPVAIAGRQSTKFRLPLKHSPNAIEQAALSGCPFFVWLWESWKFNLIYSFPGYNPKTITLAFELEAVKLKRTPVVESKSAGDNLPLPAPDCPSQVFYDITGFNVAAEREEGRTRHFSWRPFTVISDWGRKFLL